MKSLYFFFLTLLPIIILTACSVTQNLEKDEYLLYKQRIKGNKKVSKEALTEIYKQTPNRKILGTMPYLSIYYFGKKFYDSLEVVEEIAETEIKYNEKIKAAKTDKKREKQKEKKEKELTNLQEKLTEGNWIMRAPGEPPSLYDSALTNLTGRQMTYYVQSQGFFQGKVQPKVDTSGKKISVSYQVTEGPPYIIRGINYDIKDSTIAAILKNNQENSLLETGVRYNEQLLTTERERINELLKNTGYFDFTRQYIYFQVDTTRKANSVYLSVVVENPASDKSHKQYVVNKVVFDADVTVGIADKTDTSYYNNFLFILNEKNYSRRILNYKIKIQPGKLYSQKQIQETQRHLADLDMFKFININFEKNTKDSLNNTLTAYIRTSPLRKYQISDEIGLTVSSAGFVPGPFGNIAFKVRNTFGGFEIFETNLKAAVEGYSSFSDPNVILRTQEFNGNLSLTFPELLFPIRYVRYRFRNYAPHTRILAGATLIKRPEYDRLNIKNSYAYNWMRGRKSLYTFSLIDVNIINTLRTSDAFENYLDTLFAQGNNLRVSFNNSLVSNSSYTYTYNNNEIGVNKKSRYLKAFIESGGAIFNIPGIAPNDSLLGLKTFRYLKGNLDMRYYYPANLKSTFAMRYNIGVALPYDDAGVLPYEKYFFAGGSNSIRAWRPRRLGPGSFVSTDENGDTTYKFEQPGEILLEISYEYRFNIIGFLDGALFIDAGNVWAVRPESENARPGSVFRFDSFLRQIAVGTGFGLRLNFSFLILRFDVGIKAYDPARPAGERFVLPQILENPPFGPAYQTVINIGIGYPF